MSNDTAERVEQVSDDLRIVYRLERASNKWWCVVERKERMGFRIGWMVRNRVKQGFDGAERPALGEIRQAFSELREPALEGEETVEEVMGEAFDGMEIEVSEK